MNQLKGFMIGAFESNGTEPIGEFTVIRDGQSISCGNGTWVRIAY